MNKYSMSVMEIPISKIDINKNIRDDNVEIEDLKANIKEHGLLQPIIVREKHTRFSLIAGHRRLRACKALEWENIPAIIQDYKNIAIIQLSENLQRKNLSMVEESEVISNLNDQLKVSNSRLSKLIGKDPTWVKRRISYHELRQHLLSAGVLPVEFINKMTFDIARTVCKYEKKYWIQMCAELLGKRWYPDRIEEYCRSVVDPDYIPFKKNFSNTEKMEPELDGPFSIEKIDGSDILKLLFSSHNSYKQVLAFLQRIGGEII